MFKLTMIGVKLAHYRILEKIGSGGMGDVYLADDMKLDRKVALKLLPPDLSGSEERRTRFQREAKVIAALDHPNIVTVHSVEEAEGIHFITMQLVRGKSLTELIPNGGFRLTEFFDIAIPLADAVAAAHREGITHRDLKPDNVMVGDDGLVKVLDFGLAKPAGGLASSGSDVRTQTKTQEGTIVGTLAYMSPEQAQGKPVDARSDIFSMGVVFYEMLTGRRPFIGDNPAAVLSSIIKDDPASLSQIRSGLPRELVKLVRRCLAKDETRRFQSSLDIRNELEELRSEWSSGELERPARASRGRHRLGWVAVAMLAAAALAFGALLIGRHAPSEAVPRLARAVQLTSAVGSAMYPTWSPDGSRIAYVSNQSGNSDIWVVQVGGGDPINLTEDYDGDDSYPRWSPDGARIAFGSSRNGGFGLYIMPAVGGTPRRLGARERYSGRPQWRAGGAEIAVAYRDEGRNFAEIIALESGESTVVPLPENRNYPPRFVEWSPTSSAFAFIAGEGSNETNQLMLAPDVGGDPIPVTDGGSDVWSPSWSSDGTKLFFVSNQVGGMDLWEQRVGRDGRPDGEPVQVTSGVGMSSAVFSPDGTKLAYSRGMRRAPANLFRVPWLEERPATWADAEQLTFDTAYIQFIDLSMDGERVLMESSRGGNLDLWVVPVDGGSPIQLTDAREPDWAPRWSPDGTQVAFYSLRSGDREIWTMPSHGGPARQLTDSPGEDVGPAWSLDGRSIVFTSRRAGERDLWIVDADGGEPRRLTRDARGYFYPSYAPDGTWLVVTDTRTDRLWRISSEDGAATPISGEGVGAARFVNEGRTLLFSTFGVRRGNVWALSLEDGEEYPITDLVGRPGNISRWGLATDGEYVYFLWTQAVGDIWVMDVLQE